MKSMSHDDWVKFLEKEHMIKRLVWESRGIGFDAGRLYIPIKNPKTDETQYKIRRSPLWNVGNKYINPSRTPVTLYPTSTLPSNEWCVLCEGELDCLTCESFEIPAITTTGGVNGFKEEFALSFKNLDKLYIVYDADVAGRNGAPKVAEILRKQNPLLQIYIVNLPIDLGVKDIGDFFRLGHTREEFMELCNKAERYLVSNISDDNSGTETPLIAQPILLEKKVTYLEVEEKVLAFLPDSAIALKLLLAVVVSGFFKNPVMLWVLFVGVPSSGKTDLVRLSKDASITFYLDTLTANAFVSGEREKRNEKVFDLLSFLDKKCLIVKDWTAIFSADDKVTRKILGDLVGIYDKEFSKFSSQRGQKTYLTEFSQIGCVTPSALSAHTRYMNMVGPRFLNYILPDLSEDKKKESFEAIFSNVDRLQLEVESRLYVSSYIQQLALEPLNIITLDLNTRKYLKFASELLANCRGIIITQSESYTNEEGKEIFYYAIVDIQIEEPWRALQQLITLVKFLSLTQQRREITTDDLSIVKEIVLSSMPANRAQALRILIKHEGLIDGVITAKELTDKNEKSVKTSRRLLDELVGLKIVKKTAHGGNNANDYEIIDKYKNFLLQSPAEFLSYKEDETNTL